MMLGTMRLYTANTPRGDTDMPSYTTSVGNVELLALNDGMPIRSPFTPFPDTTIEQWREFPSFWTKTSRSGADMAPRVSAPRAKLIIVDTGLQAPTAR